MATASVRRLITLGLLVAALAIPGAPPIVADEATWARYLENGERAFAQGRYATAASWFRDAVREAERVDPDGARLAQSLARLAEAYRKQGLEREADEASRRAGALSAPAAGAPGAPDAIEALGRYAALLREMKREHEAAMVETRAQRLREVRGREPVGKLLHFSPVAELRDYAALLRQHDRDAEARVIESLASTEARTLVQRYRGLRDPGSFGVTTPSFAWPMQISAGLEALEARLYPEARDLFGAAVRSAETFGPDDVRLAATLSYLAYVAAARHDDAGVDRAATRALGILEKPAASTHSLLGDSYAALALAHLLFDLRPAPALAYFRRALPVLEKALIADHPVLGLHLAGLAAAHLALSERESARPALERALAIAGKQYRSEHRMLASALVKVMQVAIDRGDHVLADRVARRALAVLERTLDPAHPDVVRAHHWYARIQREVGRREKAVTMLATPTTVPIRVLGGGTFVQVTINRAETAVLMVDTGAAATIITPLVATRLGLAPRAVDVRETFYGVGGNRIRVPFVTLQSLEVGEARIEALEVGIHDVAPGATDVDGLLGADVLNRFTVTFDHQTQRMTLAPLGR